MPETSKETLKKQAQKRLALASDCLKMFKPAHSRRVLKDLRLSYCTEVFDPNPYITAFNLGKMQVIKDIEEMILLAKDPSRLTIPEVQLIDELFRSPEDDDFDY